MQTDQCCSSKLILSISCICRQAFLEFTAKLFKFLLRSYIGRDKAAAIEIATFIGSFVLSLNRICFVTPFKYT